MTTTANHDEATVELTRPAGPLPQTPAGYPAAPWGTAPGYRPGPQWPTGFPPPPPYGPQAPFGAPAPRRRGPAGISRNTWIGVAAALALVVVMIVAIVAATSAVGGSSQATRTTAPTTSAAAASEARKGLAVADLRQLLLSPREIAQVLYRPGTATTAQVGTLHPELLPDARLLTHPECQALNLNGIESAYRGTGYSGARTLTSANNSHHIETSWLFSQTLTVYPTATTAGDAMGRLLDEWKGCTGPFTTAEKAASGRTADVTWSPAAVDVTDGLATVPIAQEDGSGWGCTRGLTAVSNVVIDFTACGADMPSTAAASAAAAITGKVQTL